MQHKMSIQEFLSLYKIQTKKQNVFYSKEEITVLALIMNNHTPNGLRFKIGEIEKALEEVQDPYLVYTMFRLRQPKNI